MVSESGRLAVWTNVGQNSLNSFVDRCSPPFSQRLKAQGLAARLGGSVGKFPLFPRSLPTESFMVGEHILDVRFYHVVLILLEKEEISWW